MALTGAERNKKYAEKYGLKRIGTQIDKETYEKVVSKLNGKQSVNAYLKELIRKDLERSEQ